MVSRPALRFVFVAVAAACSSRMELGSPDGAMADAALTIPDGGTIDATPPADAREASDASIAGVWTTRLYSPPATSVLWTGTRLVAAGDSTISTSPTGARWAPVAEIEAVRQLAYGAGSIVGVGAEGAYLGKPDGTGWEQRAGAIYDGYVAVAFGASGFVAIGECTAIRSSNGFNWSHHPSQHLCGTFDARAAYMRAAAYGAGVYVAVGDHGMISSSPDGAAWTPRTSRTIENLSAVAYAGARFVAVGAGGTVLTSVDGATWQARDSGTRVDLTHVAHGEGVTLVAGGRSVFTSSDGVAWSAAADALPERMTAVTHDGRSFVAIASGIVTRSSDASRWTTVAPAADRDLVGVVRVGESLVAMASDGSSFTSPDGLDWTYRPTPECPIPQEPCQLDACEILGVASDGTTVVAVGRTGRVLTSTDGITWDEQQIAAPNWGSYHADLNGVVHGGGSFVVSTGQWGPSGMFTSPDGRSWVHHDTPFDIFCCGDIAYGKGAFVGTLLSYFASGTLILSPDGVAWQGIAPDPPAAQAVAFGGSTFVAASRTRMLTSIDGHTWVADQVTIPSNDFFGAYVVHIAHGAPGFLAVTGFNTFLQSAAGTGWRELRTTWLTLPTFEVPRLRSLVHHQGRWIVVGANSLIGTLE